MAKAKRKRVKCWAVWDADGLVEFSESPNSVKVRFDDERLIRLKEIDPREERVLKAAKAWVEGKGSRADIREAVRAMEALNA